MCVCVQRCRMFCNHQQLLRVVSNIAYLTYVSLWNFSNYRILKWLSKYGIRSWISSTKGQKPVPKSCWISMMFFVDLKSNRFPNLNLEQQRCKRESFGRNFCTFLWCLQLFCSHSTGPPIPAHLWVWPSVFEDILSFEVESIHHTHSIRNSRKRGIGWSLDM